MLLLCFVQSLLQIWKTHKRIHQHILNTANWSMLNPEPIFVYFFFFLVDLLIYVHRDNLTNTNSFVYIKVLCMMLKMYVTRYDRKNTNSHNAIVVFVDFAYSFLFLLFTSYLFLFFLFYALYKLHPLIIYTKYQF